MNKGQRTIAGLLTIMAIVATVATKPASAEVVFFDSTFDPDDWTTINIGCPVEGSGTSTTIVDGGCLDGGPFRRVTLNVNGNPTYSTQYSFNIRVGFTYDPAEHGAIGMIDYSECEKAAIGCSLECQNTGPVIRQDGHIYYRFIGAIGNDTVWNETSVAGLVAGDFRLRVTGLPCGDASQNPDFSESGGLIEVGFLRASSAAHDHTTFADIDNWMFTIHPFCSADIDGDGIIGFPDLLAILSNWGPCVGCPEDIDENNDVGFSDLLIVLSGWGPCP